MKQFNHTITQQQSSPIKMSTINV